MRTNSWTESVRLGVGEGKICLHPRTAHSSFFIYVSEQQAPMRDIDAASRFHLPHDKTPRHEVQQYGDKRKEQRWLNQFR